MVTDKPTPQTKAGIILFFSKVSQFLTAQKEAFMARSASPAMHGINLVDDNYTPSRLAEHPGAGSHEDIEPMK